MIFSYAWEFNEALAMIAMLSHSGRQFAAESAHGSSHDLLSSMCYRDDEHESHLAEMRLIYSSIKTIGPKN